MLQGENFACLISLPAAGVHLVISSRFFLYTFCLSADQQHDWKTLLLALRTFGVHLDDRCFGFLILNVIMFWGKEVVLRLGNSFIWGQSGLLMEFRCVKIRLVLLNEEFCNPTPRGEHFQYIRGGSDVIRVYVSLSTCELM